MGGFPLQQQKLQQQQWNLHQRWLSVCCVLSFVYLVGVPVAINLRGLTFQTALQEPKNQTKEAKYEVDSWQQQIHMLPACTFAHLQQAFGKKNQASQSKSSSLNTSCWSLDNEIIRIPLEHVVNRNDNMTTLGKGKSGGVYKAILELRYDHKQAKTWPRYCVAALKTNHCYERTAKVRSDKANAQPCIADSQEGNQAQLLNARFTFLDHEYMGALPWYAQVQRNQILPGILPSWALVVATNDKTNIRGVVMPLVDISMTVQELFCEEQPLRCPAMTMKAMLEKPSPLQPGVIRIPMTPSKLASIMLPAVEGLALMHQLGLAHQDVHEKNLGLVRTRSGVEEEEPQETELDQYHAILFDNTYVGMVGQDSEELELVRQQHQQLLLADKNNSDISIWNICRDPKFTIPERRKAWSKGLGPIGSDVARLRRIMLRLLDQNHDEHEKNNSAYTLEKALLNCSTAEEMVSVLDQFVLEEKAEPHLEGWDDEQIKL